MTPKEAMKILLGGGIITIPNFEDEDLYRLREDGLLESMALNSDGWRSKWEKVNNSQHFAERYLCKAKEYTPPIIKYEQTFYVGRSVVEKLKNTETNHLYELFTRKEGVYYEINDTKVTISWEEEEEL